MTKTTFVATAVTLEDGRVVQKSDFINMTYADGARIQKILWEDGGTPSWGKAWFFGSRYPEAMRNKVCQIGAGAYGDLTVWKHPDFRS